MLLRLKLWFVQCWIFRANALELNRSVPEETGFGKFGGRDD